MNRFTLSSLASCAAVLLGSSCGGDVSVAGASGTSGATGSSGTTSSSTGSSSTGSSSTGSSGTASSSTGSSGGPAAVSPCGKGPGSLGWLDTMDNGSNHIDPTDGRKGTWYTFNDGTAGGSQTPAPGTTFIMTAIPATAPVAGHTLAANTTGSGFNTYGAGMAFDFNNDGITYGAYDASSFTGVCLWARVGPGADSDGHVIRMRILDANSVPQGGVCNADPASGTSLCYDGFGADLTLTAEWQELTLPWADLTQQGWGTPEAAIDAKALYSVDFDSGTSDAFDTWVWGFELL